MSSSSSTISTRAMLPSIGGSASADRRSTPGAASDGSDRGSIGNRRQDGAVVTGGLPARRDEGTESGEGGQGGEQRPGQPREEELGVADHRDGEDGDRRRGAVDLEDPRVRLGQRVAAGEDARPLDRDDAPGD